MVEDASSIWAWRTENLADHSRRGEALAVTTAFVVWAAFAPPARAIFWNNDSGHGVTSATGLTDRIEWFQNVHQVNNLSNNTFGTTTLLDSEWAITVRHVVQNGSNYGQITAPQNVYVNVFGTRVLCGPDLHAGRWIGDGTDPSAWRREWHT